LLNVKSPEREGSGLLTLRRYREKKKEKNVQVESDLNIPISYRRQKAK